MAEKVELDLQGNSHHRVAFDLATRIAHHEDVDKKDRTYWFDLYHQCYRVVYKGASASNAKQ
jgi:hypothetical protein